MTSTCTAPFVVCIAKSNNNCPVHRILHFYSMPKAVVCSSKGHDLKLLVLRAFIVETTMTYGYISTIHYKLLTINCLSSAGTYFRCPRPLISPRVVVQIPAVLLLLLVTVHGATNPITYLECLDMCGESYKKCRAMCEGKDIVKDLCENSFRM